MPNLSLFPFLDYYLFLFTYLPFYFLTQYSKLACEKEIFPTPASTARSAIALKTLLEHRFLVERHDSLAGCAQQCAKGACALAHTGA